jgi:hypothetical protein
MVVTVAVRSAAPGARGGGGARMVLAVAAVLSSWNGCDCGCARCCTWGPRRWWSVHSGVAFVVVSDLDEFDTLNAKRDVCTNTKARETPGP